jgi:hypothetical protein
MVKVVPRQVSRSNGLSAFIDLGSRVLPAGRIGANLEHIIRDIQQPILGNAALCI